MFKRTIIYIFSAISFLNLLTLPLIHAADEPAVWLKVTASGVPGSAPRQNNWVTNPKKMLKKTFSSLFFLSFTSLGILIPTNAAEQPAIWLKVTASGVPGSAPSLNRRISTTGNTKTKTKGNKLISNKKCPQNTGKTFGALAGGLFGSSRFKSNKSKIAGAASGAIIGAGAGNPIDGCW